ncbi:YggS family pyridoxal phosphate-dependent enzyme [Streptomyces heilongjiangensis]|nr:YggS family pyridoxal phosphate-dependent enzyme [Streptomyces heilongjiangensis]MDC2950190.1 YggS family pyridoxal phosphate-dependent enzyme [Streptomyces heilongjiangensis]
MERNLGIVRTRIDTACRVAGRDPSDVTLVVVTKTWPVSDIRTLAALGVTDVGENQDQQASAKAAETADLPLRRHFLGQLQRNKAASVARYADLVHSVDRLSLVDALARGAERAGRRLPCLIQVNLDSAPGRGGTRPSELGPLADAIASRAPQLELAGVMTVAPLHRSPALAFESLAVLHERLRDAHPSAVIRSAGMSGDLEAAIVSGATHVRVGSAVLGTRASRLPAAAPPVTGTGSREGGAPS